MPWLKGPSANFGPRTCTRVPKWVKIGAQRRRWAGLTRFLDFQVLPQALPPRLQCLP